MEQLCFGSDSAPLGPRIEKQKTRSRAQRSLGPHARPGAR